MLVRLLYASRAVDSNARALQGMVATARQHNLDHGVTGVLVYQDGVFLQALEGSRSAVSHLFSTIQRDARHTDVELLLFEEIDQRSYSAWAMGVVDVGRVNASTLLRCSEKPVLDPYAVSGRTSLALIDELAASAAVSCGGAITA